MVKVLGDLERGGLVLEANQIRTILEESIKRAYELCEKRGYLLPYHGKDLDTIEGWRKEAAPEPEVEPETVIDESPDPVEETDPLPQAETVDATELDDYEDTAPGCRGPPRREASSVRLMYNTEV